MFAFSPEFYREGFNFWKDCTRLANPIISFLFTAMTQTCYSKLCICGFVYYDQLKHSFLDVLLTHVE